MDRTQNISTETFNLKTSLDRSDILSTNEKRKPNSTLSKALPPSLPLYRPNTPNQHPTHQAVEIHLVASSVYIHASQLCILFFH
mmetsp:Transcript_10526/g.22010  ORF Transcript_10526/g.22010 Transcript_10526/m.22010 type:complete len:84 (-) Transcript_10526:59-310(-)